MENLETDATIPVRRLIIELNDKTSAALEIREQIEGQNASTLFNRAMQVYDRLMRAQEHGERIIIGNKEMRIT